MKRRFFALAAVSALLLASCQEKEENLVKESLKFDSTEIVLPDGNAGSTELAFTCENVTPSAEVDFAASNWLTASVGEGKLTLTYTNNESSSERNGKITVKAGKLDPVVITVKQPVYVAPAHEYKLGEVTPDGKGMIYWVNPADPTNAKAISLERKGSVSWGAAVEQETGSTSYVNGSANTATLMAKPEAETAFPAAAYCAAMGEGWYLPALYEVFDLYDIYNGISHNDPKYDSSAVPADRTPEEKTARTDFENMLVTAGSTAKFNAGADNEDGESYWASTAEDPNGAYYIKVGRLTYTAFGVKRTSTSRFARCVKTFGTHKYPGEPAIISVDKKSLSLDGKAESVDVAVTVKNGTLKTATPDASWCTASVTATGVTLAFAENTGKELRNCNITLTAEATAADGGSASATITVAQRPSSVEAFKIGDVYKEKDKAVGVVFWVSEDGMSAKIVSMTRLASGVWAKDGSTSATSYVVASPSDTDGQANWNVIKSCADKANIPGVAFIEGLGEGWYWPSIKELQALQSAYHGGTVTGKTLPNALPEAQRNAQIAFDKALTDNGGVALNELADDQAGESYFSSTESSVATKVKYVRFGSASNDNGGKTGSRFVRGIKVVTK